MNIYRDLFYSEVISERIVEYPLMFSRLQYLGEKEKRKILDVGCYYSNFPIQLATMGFKTWAIDPEPYLLTHPNFVFVNGDVTDTEFKSNTFDVVTSVSTIEHIGIGHYKDQVEKDGDKKAISEIRRIMKPKGKLLISIPVNKTFRIGKTQRFYDTKSINELLSPEFKLQEVVYFRELKDKWVRTKYSEIPNYKGEKTRAIAFIEATAI